MCVFWVDYLSHSLSCFQCAAKGQLRCEITASLAVDANNEMHVIFNVNWWCFAWHTVVDAVAAFNITIWYYVVVVGFFAVIRCLNFLLFFTSILDIFASIHRKCSICRKIASDEQKNWNEEKSTSKNTRSMLNSFYRWVFAAHKHNQIKNELSSDRSIEWSTVCECTVIGTIVGEFFFANNFLVESINSLFDDFLI